METILLALSPIVVPLVMSLVKRLGTFDSLRDGFRSVAIRFGVALLSFGAVMGAALLNGQSVDPASVQAFMDSFLVFMASTGTYFMAKKTASAI